MADMVKALTEMDTLVDTAEQITASAATMVVEGIKGNTHYQENMKNIDNLIRGFGPDMREKILRSACAKLAVECGGSSSRSANNQGRSSRSDLFGGRRRS